MTKHIINGRTYYRFTPQEIDFVRLEQDINRAVREGNHYVNQHSALADAHTMESRQIHRTRKGTYSV